MATVRALGADRVRVSDDRRGAGVDHVRTAHVLLETPIEVLSLEVERGERGARVVVRDGAGSIVELYAEAEDLRRFARDVLALLPV